MDPGFVRNSGSPAKCTGTAGKRPVGVTGGKPEFRIPGKTK